MDHITFSLTRYQAVTLRRVLNGVSLEALSGQDFKAYQVAKRKIDAVLLDVNVARVTRRYKNSVQS